MNITKDAVIHLDPVGHITGFHLFIVFEIVGAIIGIVLIVLMLRLAREFDGVVRSAVNLLNTGLTLFVLSIILAAWMDWSHVVNMVISMTIHMGLMVVAFTIILIAAIRIIRRIR